VVIGTGSKSFTTNTSVTTTAFAVGNRVRVASSASPSNYVEGSITALSGNPAVMTVNVDLISGAGTFSSWNIGITGAQGTQGTQGTQGSIGVTGNAYDITAFFAGKPANSEVILRMIAARAFTVTAGSAGATSTHRAYAQTPSSTTTVFTIAKNGSSIMTITFTSSNSAGSFSAISATSFAAGDLLTITGATNADATLADVFFTIQATA